MDAKTFPITYTEVTLEWLNSVLPFKIKSYTEGEKVSPGFTGEVIRLIPEYENPSTSNPKSFILKFATSNPGINKLLTDTRGYLKEIELYKVLSSHSDKLHCPKVYYSAISSDNSKYIMIMEDLNSRQMTRGDQSKPIDLQFAFKLIELFANIHSLFWDTTEKYPSLKFINEHSFVDYLKDLTITMFTNRKDSFITRNKHRLSQKTIDYITSMDIKDLYAKTLSRKNNISLLHGDPQPTNLMFNSNEMTMIDWQYASYGISVKDIIIFLGIWMEESTKEDLKKIKERYYEKLLENGVKGYSKEMYDEDWKNSMFVTLANIASVSTEENIGDDIEKKKRYQEYLDTAERRYIKFFENADI